MTELKVAVMVYGKEDLSKQLNEWKTFVEANSKFKLKITEKHEPELTEITLWKKPIYKEDCYFAHRTNVNYDAIPKTNHIIMLLWKLLEGQETCLGGGTWGGDYGIHGRPYTSVPYNVWWWDESYTHEGFNTHGAQIITHEFQNALRWMLEHEYGWLCPIDPYAGDCDDMTLAECYKAIFSSIPQSVYDRVEQVLIPTEPEPGKWKEVSEPTWSEKYLAIHCVAQNLSSKEYYADAYAEDTKLTRADLAGTASERECLVHIEKEKLKEVSRIKLYLVDYNGNRVYFTTKSIPPLILVKKVTFKSVPAGASVTVTKL